MASLCLRTRCIWKPGTPVQGMYCHFVYSGSIPCTGPKLCMFCGSSPEDIAEQDRIADQIINEILEEERCKTGTSNSSPC